MFQDVQLYQIVALCLRKYQNILIIISNLLLNQGNRMLKTLEISEKKIKCLGRIPEDALLVTADVVGLYPSIPHNAGVKALYEKLDERSNKKVPSADLVDMAEFVLKNNFFEFDSKVKQQISGTATGT